MDLAKQASDCLAVAMDSVLCSTRFYEDHPEMHKEEIELLTTLRNRAHTLIR